MNRLLWVLVFTLSLNVYPNNLPPSLSNFRIENSQPSRVYFDSSEKITATNTKGFIIGSRSISGVKIISGKTTGHFFTVSKPFSFWDNDLIRYEGGSNLKDSEGNPLNNFTLRYIENNIPEPLGNGKTYYVSTSGRDKNKGTSESSSWRTISYAATKARGGDIVYIKAGDYGKENIVIIYSGTKAKPIKFIGYKNKIDDSPTLKRSVGMNFNSSEMPLLRNGENSAIICKKKSFVIIRNVQIDNYSKGIDIDNSIYIITDNIYIDNAKVGISTIDSKSANNRIINSYVANCSSTGFRLQNKNNLIDNSWAVSSKRVGMDYYFVLYGGFEGGNNTIRNSYINRYTKDSHSGHGISLKAGHFDYSLENSLIENCTVINSILEPRHRGTKNNVWRDCTLDGNRGISLNDGTSYNVFENIIVKNTVFFVRWYESSEDVGMNENGHHNIFKNCIGENINTLFSTGTYKSNQEQIIKNNSFLNCTFYKVENVYTKSIVIDNTNKMTNCNFSYVSNLGKGKFKATQTYNNYYKSFKKPSGSGNRSIDPKFKNGSNGDFRLESTSELINAGIEISNVKLDFAGSNRPQGSSHDIGAFEYNDGE